MTADVTFVLGLKRRWSDNKYKGLATQGKLLHIHYTRGRDRTYVFVHDLTSGIELPPGGKELNRGLSLGASRSCISENIGSSEARQQLFYLELKGIATQVWEHIFDVDCVQGSLSPLRGQALVAELCRFLPFVRSETFMQLIISALPNVERDSVFTNDFWTAQVTDALHAFEYMEGWWPAKRYEQKDETALVSLKDSEFWSGTLKRPQCQAKLIADTRKSDVSTTYHFPNEYDDDSATDADARPESSAVFDVWKELVLHCSTVTIESHKHASINIPFSHFLLDKVFEDISLISENVQEPQSPFWLARALAEATAEKFKTEAFANTWISSEFQLIGPFKKNHKEESYDIGQEACYVKQCNEMRPAFVLEAHRESEVIELMYVYVPMGLEREHEIQGSVRARFGLHEVAVCFLATANEKLGMGYVEDACTCTIPENARKHGGRDAILAAWNSLILLQNLEPCYNINPQLCVLCEHDVVWDDIRKTVEEASLSRFTESLDRIDGVMRKSLP